MSLLFMACTQEPTPQRQKPTEEEETSPPGETGPVDQETGETAGEAPFETPWVGLEADDETTGSCNAEIGDDLPGAGWFYTGDSDVWGAEGCWIRRERPEGASHDLEVISIAGRQDQAVTVLQIAVDKAQWVEGAITVDGEAAAGVITRYEGGVGTVVAYVVGGDLQLAKDGDDDGDEAEATFEDLQIATVSG
jgi:hypothetical protein